MTGTRANIAARAPRRWTPRALEARLVVPVAVGREGSERSVAAAGSGRKITMGWTLEEGQPRHRQRRPGRRLVAVAVAVGWEGSKRSVVAAAGVMVGLRKRWIRMGATWAGRLGTGTR